MENEGLCDFKVLKIFLFFFKDLLAKDRKIDYNIDVQ